MHNYLIGRIGAMYGQLLKEQDYIELLSCRDVSMIVEHLLNSPYKKEVSENISQDEFSGVEVALFSHLSRVFEKILELSPTAWKQLIYITFSRWDVLNLKSIIRGFHFKIPKDEIEKTFIPFGQLSYVLLKELLACNKPFEVIALLKTWGIAYCSILEKAYDDYEDDNDFNVLEYRLDHYRLVESTNLLSNKEDESFAKIPLKYEIDNINLLLCLKSLAIEHKKVEWYKKFLMNGGFKDIKFYHRLLKYTNFDDILPLISKTRDFAIIETGILSFMENKTVSLLERELEELLVKKCVKLKILSPLSIAPIIGYIWKKYNEFVNLRLILRGKYYRISNNAIKEELILV